MYGEGSFRSSKSKLLQSSALASPSYAQHKPRLPHVLKITWTHFIRKGLKASTQTHSQCILFIISERQKKQNKIYPERHFKSYLSCTCVWESSWEQPGRGEFVVCVASTAYIWWPVAEGSQSVSTNFAPPFTWYLWFVQTKTMSAVLVPKSKVSSPTHYSRVKHLKHYAKASFTNMLTWSLKCTCNPQNLCVSLNQNRVSVWINQTAPFFNHVSKDSFPEWTPLALSTNSVKYETGPVMPRSESKHEWSSQKKHAE